MVFLIIIISLIGLTLMLFIKYELLGIIIYLTALIFLFFRKRKKFDINKKYKNKMEKFARILLWLVIVMFPIADFVLIYVIITGDLSINTVGLVRFVLIIIFIILTFIFSYWIYKTLICHPEMFKTNYNKKNLSNSRKKMLNKIRLGNFIINILIFVLGLGSIVEGDFVWGFFSISISAILSINLWKSRKWKKMKLKTLLGLLLLY